MPAGETAGFGLGNHAIVTDTARRIIALAGLALLAACGRIIPEAQPPGALPPPVVAPSPAPSVPPPPPNAVALGVRAGPDVLTLGLTPATAAPALLSFRESCPRLTVRPDNSQLTQPADWKPACEAAASWATGDAARFFTENFETAVVGNGQAFVTGYYEPEIAGSRLPQPGFAVPVYGVPTDLVHARPGDAPVKPNGQTPFGRYDETGQFVPYYDRAQINGGILAGRGLEIAWAADPVEFFFLQVQGSGRLRAPDGSVMRIGYAADNGQNYTGIGIVMRDRGLIGTGPGQYAASMQGLMQYLRDHPDDGRALMNENKSWVFFRELTGDGPVGALGVPVRAHVSLATDPLFVPLGAPVFLNLDRTVANGLWVAQDTGGAIKGANRFDSFWGAGADARMTAGGMSGRGQALLLLPKGALARLGR
ncbi:MAG: MltA domain-containing protein [Sphingomonadales bacterium]|nr:MltA domain-containing protein [Sphingomonadales bacterium]